MASNTLAIRDGSRRSRAGWRVRLQCAVLACCLGAPPALALGATTVPSVAGPVPSADYPAQRERLRAEIARPGRQQRMAAMERLRVLAEANGDADLAQLMQAERIFADHDDASIDASLAQLNKVRGQMGADASLELREAMERIYGNLYFDAGNFALSLDHQLKALDLAAQLPTGSTQAVLYRLATIAELYSAMELPERALAYADQGLRLAGNDTAFAGSRTSLLGARATALIPLGRLDEAARALDDAEKLVTDKQSFNALRLASHRATLQIAMQQPGQALATIRDVQDIAARQGDNYYRLRARLLQGQARVALGQVKEGLADMRGAIAEFERLGQMIDVLDGLGREIEALHARKAWSEAQESMQHKLSLYGKLFRQGQDRAVAELDAVHRAGLRDQQIAALAAEVKLERARLRSERLGFALAIALALLAMGVAALLYVSRHRAKRERDLLSRAARHDPLTGAYSRYEFQRRFALKPGAIANAPARHLLLLDVDEFKAINDQFGHQAGDAVLKSVVSRLTHAKRADDELYRWGGEEFLLVLAERDTGALQRDIARLLHAVAGKPHACDAGQLPVTLSGGLARHPPGSNPDVPLADAIRWADAALYAAKLGGRNHVIQARLTDTGDAQLHGQRPVDVAQLQDWARQGYVRLETIRPAAAGQGHVVRIREARNSASSTAPVESKRAV